MIDKNKFDDLIKRNLSYHLCTDSLFNTLTEEQKEIVINDVINKRAFSVLLYHPNILNEKQKETAFNNIIKINKGIALLQHKMNLTNKQKELAFNQAIQNNQGHELLVGNFYSVNKAQKKIAFINAIQNNEGYALIQAGANLTKAQKNVAFKNAIQDGKAKLLLQRCFQDLTKSQRKIAFNKIMNYPENQGYLFLKDALDGYRWDEDKFYAKEPQGLLKFCLNNITTKQFKILCKYL